MSSFSDCSLPTISSAGPPKSAYMLNTYIYIYIYISDYFIPPDIYFFAYIFLRFCFAICCLRFLFMFVQMFELDA